MVHYYTKLGAGEYYLEELEETICAKEVKKLAMYANMCGNINGITPVNGLNKSDCTEKANLGKETSSTDKSENEKIAKPHNDPFSVRIMYIIQIRYIYIYIFIISIVLNIPHLN